MTKRQYLTKLENCIQALPAEERNEALDYYSNYFDDANDDDKVIEELGEPEDLAKTIIEKFTCVPAKAAAKKKSGASEEDDEETEEYESENGSFFEEETERLSFSFKKNQVKNLGIVVGAGNIVMKSGSEYKVETRGIASMDMRCELNEAGTLIIENRKKFPKKKFFSHDDKMHLCPRILITVPDGVNLENTKITLEAGQIKVKQLNISSDKTMIDVSAGNAELRGIKSKMTAIRASMGNITLAGVLTGYTKVDCRMGAVNVKMPVASDDYSYDAKIGMGSVKFDCDKRSGFGQNYFGDKKENHFSISCSMGEVKVAFDKF
ncbi:HAAS signaling domain-containing protein [Treponema sp.]|uniref:HAAS signaling domain-containing protein n=1 Tax=Treponema sp. TaxID=166 RepID=UPI00298E5D9A|nr:DUF4097 family beta strand repeat-containing protein [Treponema sp.]MCR5614372.1 DUF4097 family beta strand repeat-containing protein [Treponema sp.]